MFCTIDGSVLKLFGDSSKLNKVQEIYGYTLFKKIPGMLKGVLALLLLPLVKLAVEIVSFLYLISVLSRLTTLEKTRFHYFAIAFPLAKAIFAIATVRFVIICARVAIVVHLVSRNDMAVDIRCLWSITLPIARFVTAALEVLLPLKRFSNTLQKLYSGRRNENVWLDEDDFSDLSSIQAEDSVQIYDVWNVVKNQYLLYGGGNTLGVFDGDLDLRPVLSSPLIAALRQKLPYALSNDQFWMKYSLLRDGASISSLYEQVGGSTYTIIAVESSEGYIFGSFTTQPWRM